MTVREAFEKAYGPLPEGTTGCYTGYEDVCHIVEDAPTVRANHQLYAYYKGWECLDEDEFIFGHDISNDDAHIYQEFFGDEFKTVVTENIYKIP